MNINGIPIPDNLPAWAIILFLIAVLAVLTARVAVKNYLEQQQKTFDLKIRREKEAFDLDIQKQRGQLELEFEQRRRTLEADRQSDALIGQAMSEITKFAETNRATSILIFDEQSRAARERSNINDQLVSQGANIKGVAAAMSDLKGTIDEYAQSIIERLETNGLDLKRIIQDIDGINLRVLDIHNYVQSSPKNAPKTPESGVTQDDTGKV